MPLTFEEKIERRLCEMADWRHQVLAVVPDDLLAPDDIDDTQPFELISYPTTAAEVPRRMPAEPARA